LGDNGLIANCNILSFSANAVRLREGDTEAPEEGELWLSSLVKEAPDSDSTADAFSRRLGHRHLMIAMRYVTVGKGVSTLDLRKNLDEQRMNMEIHLQSKLRM